MKKKLTYLVLTLFGAVLLIAGCGKSGNSANEEDSGKLKVVTTFYPMYDFTKNVAQENAVVSLLVPAGTEVHDFEPSAKMIAQIENADVFVYNSDEMETWVPSVLKSIDTSKTVIVNASEGIDLIHNEADADEHDEEHEHEGEEHSHAVDPHVWLDPVLAQAEVTNIQKGLAEADPDNSDAYAANAETYQQKLEDLNQEFVSAFENATKRSFVTQHAAFAYLAKRYDLTQISVSGLSSDAEPSPAKLAELSDFVTENKVDYIYFEDNASSKIAETLADEVDVELLVLSPIEGVTQKEQDAGIDYIHVMQDNLNALKKSIQ
ncbi:MULTISPECIES: metal ABC transporter substrate-binding protein [Carnobacterium]|uniref:Metal ABC transporter solute-binding protein, Zn/Mn family n=3 Tax=Carnobacterium TaxID=2747 RepID=A0ABW4NPU0_9LACT|nr:metal ABC transporter substrate-binding protein [Carnobacterium sp. CP1]ALV22637.1 Zinc ABC transporter, periplasmic-binding protein ZnuA [Carnobacterium sp. CP1]